MKRLLGVLALVSLGLLGCGSQSSSAGAASAGGGTKPRVYVPNPALASIARELAGDAVELVTPWMGAADPAFWKPTPEQIREIQGCDAIFLNGAGYEPWSDQAALPRAKTVETTAAVKDRLIAEQGVTHSHGPMGEHAHAGTASTTWLSPELARAQSEAMAQRLGQLLPTRAADLAARKTTVLAAFTSISAMLAELKAHEPRWLASHPVYQYLAQASGIELAAVHWEPGEMPDEKEWTKFRLTRAAFPRPIAWMLWEDEPGPEVRARLEKEGVEIAVMPLFPSIEGEFTVSYRRVLALLNERLQRREGSEGRLRQ
jgi:zinc transport system substrate-binding protein